MATPPRQGVFLSHATPGDNAFTLWLGGKLAALGYDVWADIFRLKGGDDWERILEDAIRNKAAKVLVAANPVSVVKEYRDTHDDEPPKELFIHAKSSFQRR